MPPTPPVRFAEVTAQGRAGAIAVVALDAPTPEALDALLEALTAEPATPVGSARLRGFAGVDRGVLARWTPTRADLMPHGGPRILAELRTKLTQLGAREDPTLTPFDYLSGDDVERRVLVALAEAPSPLAVDLLLAQPERWARAHERGDAGRADAASLNRLLRPPVVVAVGASNIGKSSLLNALSGTPASHVADEPGTTLDAVGATLVLDGLALRWADAPGWSPEADEPMRAALDIARDLAARADLLVLCGDADGPDPTTLAPDWALAHPRRLTIVTRSDRGDTHRWAADVRTSTATGQGLVGLARAVRAALVPDAALNDPRPWLFW